jgi:hypothetical protein
MATSVRKNVEAPMTFVRTTIVAMIFAVTTPLLAQENAASTGRQSAPAGRRQPTLDSVSKATADRPVKTTEPQQPRGGRDYGSELTICRGC